MLRPTPSVQVRKKKYPRLEPRGLAREEAAFYVGVSPTKFDEMVKDARMPDPRAVDGRRVWCRIEIDEAFDALPRAGKTGAAEDPWLRDLAA